MIGFRDEAGVSSVEMPSLNDSAPAIVARKVEK